MSASQPRKRELLRNLLRPSQKTTSNPAAHSALPSATPSSHSVALRPSPTSSTSIGQRILDSALDALSPAQQQTLQQHNVAGNHDIRTTVDEAYNAASSKKLQCDDKRWRWSFRGKGVVLRDEAEKVMLWVDRFKSVGDVAVNAAPIYAGLPWAGIRIILEASISEHRQMAALLIGMNLTLAMANRLKVYVQYLEHLPPSLATANFERAMVDMYARLLRFIATAIETYQQNTAKRLLVALWQTSELEKFETDGDVLATRTDIEANNCDRVLRERNWEEAKQWKADLKASLKRLDDISTLQSSVDLLHVKVDLGKLATAQGAEYNSLAEDGSLECLPGTRTELLRQVADWSEDAQSKCIFWLCGMAGTGKSTISRTVSKRLDQQRRLGASYFFKRGEGDRGGASRFFATIALQLAHHIPGLDRSIALALDKEYELQGKSLQTQFDKLLLEPLKNIGTAAMPSSTLVIVIDALDECDRDDHQRNIVGLLARLHEINALRLRVFLTSRPDLPVKLGFCTVSGDLHHDIKLEEVQAATIGRDIRMYLRHRFEEIRHEHALKQTYDPLPADWPGPDRTEALANIAVPLFISASTVCRYVSERNPNGRLETLLAPQRGTSLSGLDEMYLTILDRMLLDQDPRERNQVLDDFRTVVGSIVLLADPLSAHSLSMLLDVSLTMIGDTLGPLHSVLHIPASPTSSIRPLHLSFRDFLTNPILESSNKFYIDVVQTHARLAQQCLRRLSQPGVLSNDVCKVSRPGARRIDYSTDYVAGYLQPDVAYACCHWAWHVVQSKEELSDDDHVHLFLQQHFLHWLEALSWLDRLPSAIGLILDLCSNAKGMRISEFLNDAYRFVLQNQRVIGIAPLQTYHSALTFAPLESIVRRSFEHSCPQLFHVSPAVSLQWSAELQKLEGHTDSVKAVVFSPDGKLVASASNDETLRIWDAKTGEQIQQLRTDLWGDEIVFSMDSRLLNLFSWRKARDFEPRMQVWDARRGEKVKDHGTDKYRSAVVAFSPNGEVIAIASQSRTIQLCDAKSGKENHLLEGHFYIVSAMTFLLNGLTLASGAMDGVVRLWDVHSGVQTHKLRGHTDLITQITALPRNGQILASASEDGTVRLWSACTGDHMHTLSNYDGDVGALAFSPLSRYLAVALADQTVRVWDTGSGKQFLRIESDDCMSDDCISDDCMSDDDMSDDCMSDDCMSDDDMSDDCMSDDCMDDDVLAEMAFSPVEQVLAVTTGDENIRLWNVRTSAQTHILKGHADRVTVLEFSSDGSTIASSSRDGTIRLWDAFTNKEKVRIEAEATSFAFSSDGTMLASASADGTIRLLNALTGGQIRLLEGLRQPIYRLVFIASDAYVAAVGRYRKVSFWHTQTGEQMPAHECRCRTQAVTAAVLSPDGCLIATGLDQGTIELWNVHTGDRMHKLGGHDVKIGSLAISPDGKLVVSASVDRSTQLWDAQSGRHLLTYQVSPNVDDEGSEDVENVRSEHVGNEGSEGIEDEPSEDIEEESSEDIQNGPSEDIEDETSEDIEDETSEDIEDETSEDIEDETLEDVDDVVSTVAFSPNSELIAMSLNKMVLLQRARTGEVTREFSLLESRASAMAFSPDGKLIAVASKRTVWLWSLSNAQQTQRLDGHSNDVRAVAFSPDGKIMATASNDCTVRLWSTKLDEHREDVKMQKRDGHDATVTLMRFSPNGQLVASASDDGTILLWDASKAQVIRKLKANDCSVAELAWSPSGLVLASANEDDDVTARLWNAQTGDEQILDGPEEWANTIVFSPDGRMICTASAKGGAQLWNPQTGEPLRRLGKDVAEALAFSPDSRYVAVVTDGEPTWNVGLWEAQTGEQIQSFHDFGRVSDHRRMCFSPDGQTVLLTCDSKLYSWNAETGQEGQTLEWPPKVEAQSSWGDWGFWLSFSKDGKSVRSPVGTFTLNWNSPTSLLEPLERTTALEVVGEWVRYNNEDLLYLPHDYRDKPDGYNSDVYGDRLVIGQASGEVTFLQLVGHPS